MAAGDQQRASQLARSQAHDPLRNESTARTRRKAAMDNSGSSSDTLRYWKVDPNNAYDSLGLGPLDAHRILNPQVEPRTRPGASEIHRFRR
jgi:hypothetical protein